MHVLVGSNLDEAMAQSVPPLKKGRRFLDQRVPDGVLEAAKKSCRVSSFRKQRSPARAKGPDFIRSIPWLIGIEGSVTASVGN
jgi:hypothetical protein